MLIVRRVCISAQRSNWWLDDAGKAPVGSLQFSTYHYNNGNPHHEQKNLENWHEIKKRTEIIIENVQHPLFRL